MAIDAGIFQNFLRPPKTVQEYDAEAQQSEGNKLGLLLQRGQYDAQQRGVAEENAFRNALSSGADEMALMAASPTRATALLKSRAEIAKEQAQTGMYGAQTKKAEADAAKTAFDMAQAKTQQHLQQVPGIQTVQDAHAWLDQAAASGELPLDRVQAVKQQLAQNPQSLAQWKQGAVMGGLTLMQQREDAMKQQEFGLRANNELIGPDGKPNTTLIGVKTGLAKAGAASTNVNVSTGQKGFDNELKLRSDFRGEPVYKAHQEMQSAYSQIQQSLKQATPAGDLAGATKIMKLLDPGSVVRESELGMAMAATGLLDRVQNYAQNIISGNKLTPKQRVEFQQLADALYGESIKAYNNKRSEYTKLGGEYGLNAERAIGGPASLAAKPAGGAKFLGFE